MYCFWHKTEGKTPTFTPNQKSAILTKMLMLANFETLLFFIEHVYNKIHIRQTFYTTHL